MCGILGFTWKDTGLLQGMMREIAYRGPDASGFCEKEGVSLGHLRLSILDLSDAGIQPMHTADKRYTIIFNGEIYNFEEIRDELKQKGVKFCSKTDTEILLYGYVHYGKKVLEKLNGMFAFAIWDNLKKELFIARDRLGIKPLYYHYDKHSGKMMFASEIKALLVDNTISREINYNAFNNYIAHFVVDGEQSIFSSIKKLLPGHFLIYSSGKLSIEKYWNITNPKKYLSKEQIMDETIGRLEQAVKYRMISDVPVGAFLSGGVDSSLICALMSKQSTRPIKTFSIGFEADSYSELKYASIVAKFLGTEHYEKIISPKDAIEALPHVLLQFGEPFADHSAIPMHFVSQLARKEVTVVLSGDGADELFGGYKRYQQQKMTDLAAFTPKVVCKIINQIGSKISHPLMDKVTRGFEFSKTDSFSRYPSWMTLFTPKMKKRLLTEKIIQKIKDLDSSFCIIKYLNEYESNSFLDRMMYADIKKYIPDDILTKVDRTTMMHSLEARVPFLDHNFVEYAMQIDPKLKLNGFKSKYVLKKLAEDYLPKEILYRKKQGFSIPTQQWFSGELGEFTKKILFSEKCLKRGFFKSDYIKELFDLHLNGARNYGSQLWIILCFEIWCRLYLDQKAPFNVPKDIFD